MPRPLIRQFIALSAIVALSFLFGCGHESHPNSNNPESLAIYSIDGRDNPLPEDHPQFSKSFHGYPVLGQLNVIDPAQRAEIMQSLNQAIAKSDGSTAKCFWPRHGIRVVEKESTTDYVICFECLQVQIHQNGNQRVIPIVRDPQSVFNRILTDAKIELAPE